MKRRIWIGITLGAVIVISLAVWLVTRQMTANKTLSPIGSLIPEEKPLDKYTIENLSNRTFSPSQIVFEKPIATAASYMVVPFHFLSDGPTSSREAGLRGASKKVKVTGLAHIPLTPKSNKMPVIVQFRGFAEKEGYYQGIGTNHSGEVYAANGFLTLAPDFLGYGGSDEPSNNAFEDRFLTYTTALNLLASIGTIPYADTDHVFLWGHSNGGQIALTVLTVLGNQGKTHPTTLWAPVTKLFPYSILYYTDEFDDYGKALRKGLAEFEKDYDTDKYAFGRYLDRIRAPLTLHQGEADPEVPLLWSNEFVAQMKKLGKSIQYYTYPASDHNLSSGWSTVVERDIQFFKSFLP